MTTARLKVIAAGPLVSFQDAGRPGLMRFGVPASGPMDRFSHAAANAMLGNPSGATCVEVSLGGLVLECIEGEVTCAVAGGAFRVGIDNKITEGWIAATLGPGSRLSISGGAWGSWCYLALAGTLAAPRWLSATATHTLSGLGGGALQAGDVIVVENATARPARDGVYDAPDMAKPRGTCRVVVGPQDERFEDGTVQSFCAHPYKVTDAYNRMGMRLDGAPLPLGDALSIPSEPIVRGSIQVAGDGIPTLLLADHQTTGGYPKIATAVSADLDRITQLRSGDEISFDPLSPEDAVSAGRDYARNRSDALATLAAPRLSLDQRLLRENLISGAVSE